MKYLFIIIALLILGHSVYSQKSYLIEGKDYCGYVFTKEHSIYGFPPESNRCTLTEENIIQAEAILKKNISTEYVKKYVKSWQSTWKARFHLNKMNLKKYYRQYVGYLTQNNEVVVHIFLIRKSLIIDIIKEMSEDIVAIFDGGSDFWSICINLHTEQVFNMEVNGIG